MDDEKITKGDENVTPAPDETAADKQQDKELESHETSDAEKWEKVFGMLSDLTKRMDGFEKWANYRFMGVDKTEEETAEAVDDGGSDYPAAEADREFYDRQKMYLTEGGY